MSRVSRHVSGDEEGGGPEVEFASRGAAARVVELRAFEVLRLSGPVGPRSRLGLFLPPRTSGDSGKAEVVRRRPSPVREVVHEVKWWE